MPPTKPSNERVLLVYYGRERLDCLEGYLRAQSLVVFGVNGRAPDALEQVATHPADAVVIVNEQDGASFAPAVRQIGQILPKSLLITTSPYRKAVGLYQGQSRVGQSNSLGASLAMYRCLYKPATLHNTSAKEALTMGTYDLASAVDRVKAIDEALKHYYGAENWLAVRRKRQPGINQHQEEVSHATQDQDE